MWLGTTTLWAQEHGGPNFREHHLHNSIGFGLSHTHVFNGVLNGKPKWTILPSFLLDYDYHLNERWSLGGHFDMVVENFIFKLEEGSESIQFVERSFPVSFVATGSYKVFKYMSLQLGAGGEFVLEGENYPLIRGGLDFEYEVGELYEVFLNASYDYRFEAYHSLTVGLGIKRFF
jgi:hypothetical protein